MKQLTRSEFNKQGTTYKSVTSPASDNDVTQITDIVENNGNLAFSTDGSNYKTITKEVQSVNDISDIYPSKNALPSGIDGDVLCALTNGVLPLSLYEYNGTTNAWEYIDQVRENVVYLDKTSGLLYTFRAQNPYFYVTSYTKTSELTNDSNYATTTDVSNAVSAEETARQNADTTLQNNINAKYTKPATGIPKTDLAQGVQDSLGLADTALQDGSDVVSALGYTPYNASNPNNYTNVTASNMNGHLNINGVDTTVYDLPNDVATTTDVANAVAGKQDTIDATHKLSADLVDDTSTTNKFVTASDITNWNAKQNALSFDSTPTQNSTNPVTSGGVYTAVSAKQDTLTAGSNITISNNVISATVPQITVDNALSTTSENPVQNKVVTNALDGKMNTTDPVGTGTLSINRKANTTVGRYSTALGTLGTASGEASHAEGSSTTASGASSHAEGVGCFATNQGAHAEGMSSTASGVAAHAEGSGCAAVNNYSHAEGQGTFTSATAQHVFGKYNKSNANCVEIVGNGTGNTAALSSNARTLDWSGNEVLAGTSTATGFIVPNGTSSQFLKADGSTDSTTYATSSDLTTGLSGKQDIIGSSNKLSADLVDDTNTTNKFVTSADKTAWNGKQDALTQTQLNAVNSGVTSSTVSQVATNTSDIGTIEGLIPDQATTSNQLADKNFVNSSINAFAAYYITKNAAGDPFATKAELTSASTFYSGGVVRVPTTNDYCIVLADESKQSTTGVDPTTRYSYQGNQWEYQYTINDTPLTSAQLAALNSGITSALVTQIGTNTTAIAGKQDTITSTNKLDYSLIANTPTIIDVVQNGNMNAVTSNAVFDTFKPLRDELDTKQDTLTAGTGINIDNNNVISATGLSITIDSALSTTSTNPVQNKVVTSALNNRLDLTDTGSQVVIGNIEFEMNQNTSSGTLVFTTDHTVSENQTVMFQDTDGGLVVRADYAYATEVGEQDVLITPDYIAPILWDNATSLGKTGARWKDLHLGGNLTDGTNSISVANIVAKQNAITSTNKLDYSLIANTPTIPAAVTSINGLSGGTLTSPLIASGGDAATAAKIVLDQSHAGQITNNSTATIFGFTSNNATTLTVGHSSYALALRGSGTRPKYNSNDLALLSDVPSGTINDGTLTIQFNGSNVQTFTANQSTNATANIQALPNYSLSIGSTNGGNPRQVLFCSVNYTNFDSNSGAYFKLGAMSGHGNGSSYTFVEDIFINVNYQGTVTCQVYKYVQQAVTLDNVARNYGDVFYTIDTTNKIVYFYILLGQYSSAQFTPGTKIGAAKAVTSANGIVQYTGTPTYYSSGTKTWATGDSATYVRSNEVPTTSSIVDLIYPVGSYFITESSSYDTAAKVQEHFGGTWTQVTGRFLYGSSSAGSTGGSNNAIVVSHSHTFTGTQTSTSTDGSHTHLLTSYNNAGSRWLGNSSTAHHSNWGVGTDDQSVSAASAYYTQSTGSTHSHSFTATGTISTDGSSGTNANMPAYRTVFMYRRTA